MSDIPICKKDKVEGKLHKMEKFMLRRSIEKDMVDSFTCEEIRPMGIVIDVMQELTKIDKNKAALRPIFDTCNSSYHTVTKVLKLLRKRPLTVSEMFQFGDCVKHLSERR